MRRSLRFFPIGCLLLAGLGLAGDPVMPAETARTAASSERAAASTAAVRAFADELLAHLQATSLYVRVHGGLPVTYFDDLTHERARDEAQFNRRMLARVDAISLEGIPHADWLLARILRQTFLNGMHADEDYWFTFVVTPYTGGMRLSDVHAVFANHPLATAEDRERYLRLVDAYAVMLEQMSAKTRAQAERGIRVAQPAIDAVVSMLGGLREGASRTLVPAADRLRSVSPDATSAFTAAVEARVGGRVSSAYTDVLEIFDARYRELAPSEVGIRQYPGGKAAYRRLVRAYTGLDLTPRQIHDLGRRRVAELERQMKAVRTRLGFTGSREAFHERLLKDPRFIARTPQEMGERLMAHVTAMEAHLPAYFSKLPRARHAVRPLDPALAGSQTFGYYSTPTPEDPVGYYYFNGSDLERRSLFSAAHLMFHELVPGHHLQLALQLESTGVHPVRRVLDNLAFVEGWAEYAASLGKEMGLYADPYDLYGQLAWESFFATRLVVDTGMNDLGWSLERARAYMKAHVLNSDTEIASETVRYSTDYFGQALTYRLGYEKIWELRRRAERALGKRFDVRAFHAAVMEEGGMPLGVLDEHVSWFIEQQP